MDTDTSGGNGRQALGCAALVLGPILAYLVSFYCAFYQLVTDLSTVGQTGAWAREVESLNGLASQTIGVIWVMIPVAPVLYALVMFDGRGTRQWLRPLAAAVGIFTGILLAVYVVLTAVAWHLSRSI